MEGPDITGGFKFSIGRPGLLRPEDGTTKAKGRPGLLRPEDGAAKAKRRSGLLRPEDGTTKAKGRYYEGQGTVVPTSAGLRPTLVSEERNLPYFAKASKGL